MWQSKKKDTCKKSNLLLAMSQNKGQKMAIYMKTGGRQRNGVTLDGIRALSAFLSNTPTLSHMLKSFLILCNQHLN